MNLTPQRKKMKMNKVLTGLLITLTLFLVSKTSTSDEGSTKTIVLSEKNLLVLNGVIDEESAGNLILKARDMDQELSSKESTLSKLLRRKKEPIYLYLDTPGGSIEAGLQIIEILNGLGRKVNTISAFSASMGFQLVESLGDRLVLKSGILMSHHAAGGMSGQFGGLPTQLDSRYALWLNIIKEMDLQTVKRTQGKQTYDSYIKSYDKELWDTGAKAVNDGYADEVVSVKCDDSLSGTDPHTVEFMGLMVSYDTDKCPVNSNVMNVRVVPGQMAVPPGYIDMVKTKFSSSLPMSNRTPIPMVFNALN